MSRSLPNEQAKPRRLLSQIDEELVAEGVRGIQSGRWANPHQAAKCLRSVRKVVARGFRLSQDKREPHVSVFCESRSKQALDLRSRASWGLGAHVRFWHKADICLRCGNVRFWG